MGPNESSDYKDTESHVILSIPIRIVQIGDDSLQCGGKFFNLFSIFEGRILV